DDLAAGQLAVAGDAHLEGDLGFGEVVLGAAHEADLGDRVDADGLDLVHPGDGLAAGVVGGEAALLHGRGGEGRETDHVADGVDVRDLGAVVGVHLDAAAVVGGQAGGLQAEVVGHAVPARGVHDGVGGDALAALQDGD